jgi:AcrR family transcriptional regulator
MGSLRDDQKKMARLRILEALAAEISENGLLELSMPAVAERAGVSQRTIYNHFENKDVLVRSLGEWVEEWIIEHGGPSTFAELDEVPEHLPTVFSMFSEMGEATAAVARIRADFHRDADIQPAFDSRNSKRTEAMRDGLSELRPDLNKRDLDAATAMFRAVVGFETWYRLAIGDGLTGSDAGALAGWAFSEMLEGFKQGRGPFGDDSA